MMASSQPSSHFSSADTHLEWAYAFDVHTNAFFPLYLSLYLVQLFLVSVVTKDRWVCLWLGNTLYLAAYVSILVIYSSFADFSAACRFTQYIYITYLGMSGKCLPKICRFAKPKLNNTFVVSSTIPCSVNPGSFASPPTIHGVHRIITGLQHSKMGLIYLLRLNTPICLSESTICTSFPIVISITGQTLPHAQYPRF